MTNPVDLSLYPLAADAGQAGSLSSTGPRQSVERAAQEEIEFGRAVVTSLTAANKGASVKNIKQSQASVTYSVDFVASNSIPMTVNGLSITPVVYASSHAATFAALIAAIDALAGISAVAGTGREILITIDGGASNIAVSNTTVTGGSGQPTVTTVYSTIDTFEGFAILMHRSPLETAGDDKYRQYDPVSVLRKGKMWVYAVATVNYGDSIYVYADSANPTNQGMITNSASGNLAVSTGKIATPGTSVGTTGTPVLVEIEINLP